MLGPAGLSCGHSRFTRRGRMPSAKGAIVQKRTMIIAATLLGTLVLLLPLAAYLVLRNLDLDSYRPQIQAQVKAATGRELAIGGALRLALRGGLVLRADDLALSNAAWGGRPQMLTLGRVEAQLALLPLLAGDIRIERIELHDVDLLLETDTAGMGNWELGPPGAGTDSGMPDIRAIAIESGRVTWQPAGQTTGKTFELTAVLLEPQVDRVRVQISGTLGQQRLELAGHTSRLSAWSGPQPWLFDLDLHALGARVAGKGMLRHETWGLSPTASISATGVDLAALGGLVGRAWTGLPPLDLAFTLARDAAAWQVSGLKAEAGGSDLTGDLRLTVADTPPRLSGQLVAGDLDLATLIPRKTIPASKVAKPLFDSAPLAFDALRGWTGELQMRVGRLTGLDPQWRDLQFDVRLADALLTLNLTQAALGQSGSVEGRVELATAGDASPAWTVKLQAQRIPAALLLGSTGRQLVDAPADLRLDLLTRGDSSALMAANLAGELRLSVGPGRAQLKAVDTLVGGLSTLTGQLLEQGADDTSLNCVIADFSAQRGVLKANVLLIDSAASTVRGDGKVNLGTERIDLTFTPHPKTATLNVAVPVHVRGPLRQPEFIPDRMASLKKLVGVVGLFVYPPAALATLGDLGESDNACVRLLRGDPERPSSGSAVDRIQQGVEGAAQGIGKGLKGLFGG